jgi:membrane-bound lytic murein transglycosylase F
MWLALAAYNIGFGHVEDARIITEMQGGNPDSWDEVRIRLPLLSNEDWHSRVERGFARGAVPVEYVDNVRRYYTLLQWMAGTEILTASSVSFNDAPERTL